MSIGSVIRTEGVSSRSMEAYVRARQYPIVMQSSGEKRRANWVLSGLEDGCVGNSRLVSIQFPYTVFSQYSDAHIFCFRMRRFIPTPQCVESPHTPGRPSHQPPPPSSPSNGPMLYVFVQRSSLLPEKFFDTQRHLSMRFQCYSGLKIIMVFCVFPHRGTMFYNA